MREASLIQDLLAALSAIDRELQLAGDAIRQGELMDARKSLRHAINTRAAASRLVRELRLMLKSIV